MITEKNRVSKHFCPFFSFSLARRRAGRAEREVENTNRRRRSGGPRGGAKHSLARALFRFRRAGNTDARYNTTMLRVFVDSRLNRTYCVNKCECRNNFSAIGFMMIKLGTRKSIGRTVSRVIGKNSFSSETNAILQYILNFIDLLLFESVIYFLKGKLSQRRVK